MSDARPLPSWVTKPLLTVITEQSLDLDYEHAARRKARRSAEPAGGPTGAGASAHGITVGTTIVVVVFGVLLAMAAIQTLRTAAVRNASNAELISRIDARRTALTDLQRRTAQVQQSTANLRSTSTGLGKQLQQANGTIQHDGQLAGFAAASGPGVQAVVADAPDGNPSGQVRDEDLAKLVNGLWRAGATAISVNGERLTAASALRNSGTVIRTNGVSLSSPYTVLALGNAATMVPAFEQSTTGHQFDLLVQRFDMPFTLQNESKLTLPPAPASLLALGHVRILGAAHSKETP